MAERQPPRAVLIGANGRMGRAIVEWAARTGELEIVRSISAPSDDLIGALKAGEVVLDFSRGDAAELHVEACRKGGKPLVLGTTGHSASLEGKVAAAARDIPLLVAPNTSFGIAVLLELVQRAARALPAEYDVEIFEAHHREKRDAPSGTALAIGEAIARARGSTLAQRRAPPRQGPGMRKPGEIGFAVVRAGEIVGEHEVRFAGNGEEITLGHRAHDRSVFARGAIKAARWLAACPPGRYQISDLLSKNQ
jgi:4-hydroxy-tetrahydrodipicolinate reductase